MTISLGEPFFHNAWSALEIAGENSCLSTLFQKGVHLHALRTGMAGNNSFIIFYSKWETK
jgi:hypothetical protein